MRHITKVERWKIKERQSCSNNVKIGLFFIDNYIKNLASAVIALFTSVSVDLLHYHVDFSAAYSHPVRRSYGKATVKTPINHSIFDYGGWAPANNHWDFAMLERLVWSFSCIRPMEMLKATREISCNFRKPPLYSGFQILYIVAGEIVGES